MAGIFGMFDYTKEGPGIPKDAPPKSRFVIFFEVLARKFWKIIRVNLMFGVFNIPAFLFLLIFAASYSHLFIPSEIPETDQLRYLLGGTVPLLSVFLCLPMITVGPAQAGMTYILRNFSREEHAFFVERFYRACKEKL